MSAVTAPSAPGASGGAAGARSHPGGGISFGGVLRSEWTKLWSLRSTRWSLLVAFIAQAGLGVLIAVVSMARWNHMSQHDRLTFNPIDMSLGGYHIAQLAVGVLGVLVISGEYSTGQIRSSLMAVPKRLPVLWAKMLVFSAIVFVLILVSSIVAFFAAQAIFTQHHVNVTIGHATALRAIIGQPLYLTVVGIMCIALGTIVRATAGGISTFVGILFVLPGIVEILPASVGNTINPYLPSNAGIVVAQSHSDSGSLAPWPGFALFCGYTILAVAIAAYLLRRRDA